MLVYPSSFILCTPFVSIANNKKVKFDGARCPFSTFLRLQGDHHCACAQSGIVFHCFSRAFKQKIFKALRPKMTKIAPRGSCMKTSFRFEALKLQWHFVFEALESTKISSDEPGRTSFKSKVRKWTPDENL